jgi:signal recognition particle subunit SRP54
MPGGMPDLSKMPPGLDELPPGLAGLDQLPAGFDPKKFKLPKAKNEN